MASAPPTIRLSDLSSAQYENLEQNVSHNIGVASLNLAKEKTHAISKVIFKKSYTEARVCFTREQILYGWPKHMTGPSPTLDYDKITPGGSSDWDGITYSLMIAPYFLENPHLIKDYHLTCFRSVQHVTLEFDSERTYENSLLKSTIVRCCKAQFPNLRSYSLVFDSL